MDERLSERRRRYFIDRGFQTRFIVKFCLLVTAGTLVSGAATYFLSTSTVTTSFENSRLVIKSTADFMLPAILISGAIVTVAIGIATIFVTLFTSHKISGPLYRLEKDLVRLKDGDLKTAFQIRSGDQLQGLRDSLDELTRTLQARIAEMKDTVSQMAALSNERNSDALREKIDRLKNLLSGFNA